MAEGFLYTVSFQTLTVAANAAQSIWEFTAAPGTSILIHSVRLSFMPQVLNGVLIEMRLPYSFAALSGPGLSGHLVMPSKLDGHQIPAVTACTCLASPPGTISAVYGSGFVPVADGLKCTFTPDERIPVSGGSLWGLVLTAGPSAPLIASAEATFEEI